MTNRHSTLAHILIVDDERTTRRALSEAFVQSGFHTESAATGYDALQQLQSRTFDAVILDMHLADEVTGLDILGVAQEIAPDTAFIVLTGHATTESAIMALRSGAYDYLQKPASLPTIIATTRQALEKRAERLREKDAVRLLRQALTTLNEPDVPAPTEEAALPHSHHSQAESARLADLPTAVLPSFFTLGDITLDDQRQRVTYAGQELTLTPIEYKLLHYMMRHPNMVLTYAELAEISHDMPDLDEGDARTLLRTHVYRLSRKLGQNEESPLQTVRGRGVMLAG